MNKLKIDFLKESKMEFRITRRLIKKGLNVKLAKTLAARVIKQLSERKIK